MLVTFLRSACPKRCPSNTCTPRKWHFRSSSQNRHSHKNVLLKTVLSTPTTTNSLRGKLCVGGYPPFQKPFVLILQAPKQQSCDNLHPHSRTVTLSPTPVALQRPQQYLGTLLLLASKCQTPNNLADHAMNERAFITQCAYSFNSTAITYTQSAPTHVKLCYNANGNTVCIANFIGDSQQLRTVTT